MCGFLGAIDFGSSVEGRLEKLRAGLQSIRHRGPDGTKEKTFENYFLGQNRLSIIDLSHEADQPMVSADGRVIAVFNGEIYNYKELKSQLSDVKFRTSSDTEVIIEGYILKGTDFFRSLRGIYSFALLDLRQGRKFILFRDPAGVKPLYLFSKNEFHIFGSEMKALMPAIRNELTVNEEVLKCFLNLGYCPEPLTIYSEIEAVRPGHIIEITEKEKSVIPLIEYEFEETNGYGYSENKTRTEDLLKKAVARNLVADVDVAVALSGGIDSSLIYAYAHESESSIKGLTIEFSDKEHDESETAQTYADTVGGKLERIKSDNSLDLDLLNKILRNFDQPYADSSAVNVYFLTRASSKVTKVLLGGDGGDELYNGYPSMTWLSNLEMLGRSGMTRNGILAMLKASAKISGNASGRVASRLAGLWSDKPVDMLYDWHSWFPRKTTFEGKSPFLFDTSSGLNLYNSLFDNEAPEEFKQHIVFDYFRKTMLSDYLRKTDMMAMLNSVEYRVPFLDEDLASFALTIPFRQKSRLKSPKKILRDLHRKIYPKKTSMQAKKGFTIPLDKSLSSDEFAEIENNLLGRSGVTLDYVSEEYVKFLFGVLNGRRSAEGEISRAGVYQRILMLYSLNMWHENK